MMKIFRDQAWHETGVFGVFGVEKSKMYYLVLSTVVDENGRRAFPFFPGQSDDFSFKTLA